MTPVQLDTAPKPPLPPLRQELIILRDKLRGRWMIHDPIRGRFHAIGPEAFTALSQWAPVPPEEFLAQLNQRRPDLGFDETALTELSEFLVAEKLLDFGGAQDAERIAAQEAFTRKPWHEQLIHKYLFFKIPLWQPQKFL